MIGEISWTEDSEAHIARHGVTPGEVEEALYTRPRWTESGRAGTTLTWCRTANGRWLLVVTAESHDGRDYVVTARDMDENEKSAFRKRKR